METTAAAAAAAAAAGARSNDYREFVVAEDSKTQPDVRQESQFYV